MWSAVGDSRREQRRVLTEQLLAGAAHHLAAVGAAGRGGDGQRRSDRRAERGDDRAGGGAPLVAARRKLDEPRGARYGVELRHPRHDHVAHVRPGRAESRAKVGEAADPVTEMGPASLGVEPIDCRDRSGHEPCGEIRIGLEPDQVPQAGDAGRWPHPC